MNVRLDFDLSNVTLTEFGVGREDGEGQSFVSIPVGKDVQVALCEIIQGTWRALQADVDGPRIYEPSEKHGSKEYLYLPLDDQLAASLRELHEATGLTIDTTALAEPQSIFCYFARLKDKRNRRLTALRRATQFKGIFKSKNRLVRIFDDTLRIIDDTVFKLDNEFDLLMDTKHIHILRPSGFEFAGKLQAAILGGIPVNLKVIQKDLPFVAFDGIAEYAGKHTRAARYLASIRSRAAAKGVDKVLLKKSCREAGIRVSESKGKLKVAVGHEMDFLEVLDRRLYEVNLVRGKPERYRASSRKKING